ncbi:hypothetical protein [Neorhizobium alkalisoli]|uniref:Transmembrane anchored protein n=1 Tax=Neorhizobium alkalisoli TaxID=528178 RepID=A0A561Q7N3_9HYPH|nr:hypothetical protein [Neorhizobium alkalisoli]TWF46373.1 hypothetical protein FHW37_11569 [Neorhizobium alkalisoli]
MAHSDIAPDGSDESPLLSNCILWKLTFAIAALALLTLGISLGSRWLGERMALGGHTESRQDFLVTVGQDRLKLAANTIRFRDQRHDGVVEHVDLYLAWPELEGYSASLRSRFDDISQPASLIFLQLSQSIMSRDMSGRVEPIYTRLFDGPPEKAPFGLTLHRMRADSGYGEEVVLTAQQGSQEPYAVRCLLPMQGEKPTNGDCQRDIRVGQDLTILYRFSSGLLRDWRQIDSAVRAFVEKRLVDGRG